MNQSELDIVLEELEDLRQRLDSIYRILTKSENDLRKKLDTNYRALWKVIKMIGELKQ